MGRILLFFLIFLCGYAVHAASPANETYSREIKVPKAPPPSPLGVLKVKGSKIVAKNGTSILLRGAGLGGHLNMENCKQDLS
jgi:hypothetical protein